MNESDQDYFDEPFIKEYVDISNIYMNKAMEYSRRYSLDKTMPTGAVIVKNNEIIGLGANGSNYHDSHVCERVRLNIPTGQGYDLCEGCHYKNHAEIKSIEDALSKDLDIKNTELYLWGHWWLCRWCRESIAKAGIRKIFLLKDSEILFNKNKEGNIVGKQFNK